MRSFFLLAIIGAGLTPFWSQANNGTLSGAVADPYQAEIPGVQITATNMETPSTNSMLTDGEGKFSLRELRPGVYTLRASLSGFQSLIYENINLAAGEARCFNIVLRVRGAGQPAEVRVDASKMSTSCPATDGQTS